MQLDGRKGVSIGGKRTCVGSLIAQMTEEEHNQFAWMWSSVGPTSKYKCRCWLSDSEKGFTGRPALAERGQEAEVSRMMPGALRAARALGVASCLDYDRPQLTPSSVRLFDIPCFRTRRGKLEHPCEAVGRGAAGRRGSDSGQRAGGTEDFAFRLQDIGVSCT